MTEEKEIKEKKKLKAFKLINFEKILGLNTKETELHVKDGLLKENNQVSQSVNIPVIDCKECIISPGFIDPQVNGLNNFSFWNLDENVTFKEIDDLRLKLAYCGVVGFCPTIITDKKEKIIKSIDYLNSYIKDSKNKNGASGAEILGIHLEGIFITKYGIHNSQYANHDLSIENISPFIKDNVILFTLAPELDKTGKTIEFLQKNNILVSIGHSNGSYKEGEIAIKEHGLRSVTHMFNALRGIDGFNHRNKPDLKTLRLKLENDKNIDPENDGIMLALLKNKDVVCMVIADGIHVNSDVIDLLKEYKDKDHFSLASDIVPVNFSNSIKMKDTLGGGQLTINKCISNLINWKVSNIEDCLIFASKPISNQLKTAKEQDYGEILINKKANIVLWDKNKNSVKGTIIGENVFLNY